MIKAPHLFIFIAICTSIRDHSGRLGLRMDVPAPNMRLITRIIQLGDVP